MAGVAVAKGDFRVTARRQAGQFGSADADAGVIVEQVAIQRAVVKTEDAPVVAVHQPPQAGAHRLRQQGEPYQQADLFGGEDAMRVQVVLGKVAVRLVGRAGVVALARWSGLNDVGIKANPRKGEV